uniref:Lipocalin/cytosolic fatty-acid binding domain-containing protein n=1 Tax=Homalodisca liturata TaxID=320908 RepID=A0A1B6JTI0_9HEMI
MNRVYWNYSSMKVFVLVAAYLAVAAAECPNLTPVQSFDIAKYLGTWYHQASTENFASYGPSRCAKTEYTLDSTTGIVHIKNSIKSKLGEETITGSMELADPTKDEGKLNIKLQFPFGTAAGQVLVLATDYDNYAIIYTCRMFSGVPTKHAWILTREQHLDGDARAKVEALVDVAFAEISSQGGPKKSDFRKTGQENC